MKKFYLFASALLAVTTLKAQTTVNFEELSLSAESFYNGSDEAGGFYSAGILFGNSYNTAWDSWSGFSYSNITDNTTPGFGNQYSAIPGAGAGNSEIYSVYYNGDTLYPPTSNSDLISVDLTNTTYAYFAMKDGDAYSKQFGSTNDANGNDDGTNGEDFFKITIYSHDSFGNKDSLDFYLADYRFSDNSNDYIIDSWTNVDLSQFTNVEYLTFGFSSSDVGGFGINTPQYFAMDNLVYNSNLGVETYGKTDFAIYPNPAESVLNIKGDAGEYKIYNTSGSIVKEFTHQDFSTIDISHLLPGVYIVKVSNGLSFGTRKLIVQ